MSKPSFSNIDLWLFEYAEGNLTDDQVAKLELFILQHPELDVERDMWEMAQVKQEEVVYSDQNALIKRKPIGAYWAAGAGALTMIILIFGSFAFFGIDESQSSEEQFSETLAYAEEFAYQLLEETATERELRQEVSDLKALVTTLEDQLQRSNTTSGRNQNGNQGIVATLDATITGIDSGNGRELRPIGAGQRSLIASNASNRTAQSTNNTSGLPSTSGTQSATGMQGPSWIQNTNTAGTSIQALANAAPVRTMQPMSSMKPTFLESQRLAVAPVSRELYGKSVVSNDGTETIASANESQGRSVNYESSYKHKVSKFVRQLRNMANNPIALKNYRDAYHHVPGMTATDLNFGATGTMIAPRFQAMSRLQGLDNENELFTNQIGLDGYVYGARGGVGVQMTHHYYNNGGIQSGEVAITYSPKFSVNRKLSIEPAFRFKMGNKMLNSDRMEGTDQVEFIPGNTIDYYQDGTAPVGRMLWYRDMGLGLNVNTEWFYASAQVDNIFRHNDNIYSNDLGWKRRAGTYFVATLGTDWESDDSQWETKRSKFSLSPYLVYRNYENVNELWAGANFRAYWLTVGASVSSNGDPAASLGVVSSDKRFSLMYNADYSRSFMTNERSLSHQLTLRIVGKQSRIGRRN